MPWRSSWLPHTAGQQDHRQAGQRLQEAGRHHPHRGGQLPGDRLPSAGARPALRRPGHREKTEQPRHLYHWTPGPVPDAQLELDAVADLLRHRHGGTEQPHAACHVQPVFVQAEGLDLVGVVLVDVFQLLSMPPLRCSAARSCGTNPWRCAAARRTAMASSSRQITPRSPSVLKPGWQFGRRNSAVPTWWCCPMFPPHLQTLYHHEQPYYRTDVYKIQAVMISGWDAQRKSTAANNPSSIFHKWNWGFLF